MRLEDVTDCHWTSLEVGTYVRFSALRINANLRDRFWKVVEEPKDEVVVVVNSAGHREHVWLSPSTRILVWDGSLKRGQAE